MHHHAKLLIHRIAGLTPIGLRGGRLGRTAALLLMVCACGQTARGQDDVSIRLATADLFGNPISSAMLGDDFLLQVFVQDLRETSPNDDFGVFAAYLDLEYPDSLVNAAGPIEFGPTYPSGRRGDTVIPGLIDEAGAFSGAIPLGKSEQLLLSVPFLAVNAGNASFASNPADDLPLGYVLVYGQDVEVPTALIDYGATSLNIVPEPSGLTLLLLAGAAGLRLGGGSRRRP